MEIISATAEFLNPRSLGQDPGFVKEINEAGRRGLKYLGLFSLCVPMATAITDIFTLPDQVLVHASIWRIGLLLVLGTGMLMMARWLPPPGLLRLILPSIVFLLSAVQVVANFWASLRVPAAYHYTPGLTAVVIFLCAALLPLKPWQTLAASLTIDLAVVASERVIRTTGWLVVEDLDGLHLVTMVTVSFIATIVSSVLWRQREKQYQSGREAVESRSRALLAEHSAALGQISATISHEINSPLGTLVSAAATMQAAGRKLADASPESRHRLLRLQAELGETVRCASDRIEEIVRRMQLFSNLEGPEEADLDINTLLRTALDMASVQDKVMFDPELVAPVRGRPAEISFVLYTLARVANNGKTTVWVRTRMMSGAVMVTFSPLRIPASDFELRFVAEGSRVAAGNASLFAARQIARRHGGEIVGEPALTLTLPAAASAPLPDTSAAA